MVDLNQMSSSVLILPFTMGTYTMPILLYTTDNIQCSPQPLFLPGAQIHKHNMLGCDEQGSWQLPTSFATRVYFVEKAQTCCYWMSQMRVAASRLYYINI